MAPFLPLATWRGRRDFPIHRRRIGTTFCVNQPFYIFATLHALDFSLPLQRIPFIVKFLKVHDLPHPAVLC